MSSGGVSSNRVERAVGRAKAVLVLPNTSTAFVVTVTAMATTPATERRLWFQEGITVAADVIAHIVDVLLRIVDWVCAGLGLARKDFVLTVASPDTFAAKDLSAGLSGHSADLSILLSLLSAALDLPIKQDVASTGRLISPTGEIGMVSGLDIKAAAAAGNPGINLFLCPDSNRDHSMESSTPREFERVMGALAQAASEVRIVRALTVADAFREVCEDADIVRSAFSLGFFASKPVPVVPPSDPTGMLIWHLMDSHESRFWAVLEECAMTGEREALARLLSLFCEHYTSQSCYPSDAGARLRYLVAFLPPAVRRLRVAFPLLPPRVCAQLGQFVQTQEDSEDFFLLLGAVLGRLKIPSEVTAPAPEIVDEEPRTLDDGETAAAVLLSELSSESIERSVGARIDAACLGFRLESIGVESTEAFRQTISSFYARLEGVSRSLPPADLERIENKAISFVGEAFQRDGGYDSALAEAMQPTRLGGMRYIINGMTEHYKAVAIRDHVLLLMTQAVDSRSCPEKVAMARALLRRLRPFLPKEATELPAEAFINDWRTLARACVRLIDETRGTLRNL